MKRGNVTGSYTRSDNRDQYHFSTQRGYPTQSGNERDPSQMAEHRNPTSSTSQSIADRLREFKTASSAKDRSVAVGSFENNSNYQSSAASHKTYPSIPQQGYTQEMNSSQSTASQLTHGYSHNTGSSQTMAPPQFPSFPQNMSNSAPQFYGQHRPPVPPSSSVSFPPQVPPPVFNPSAAPPGSLPFLRPPPPMTGPGTPSHGVNQPLPFLPQNNFGAVRPPSAFGMMAQQNNFGTAQLQNTFGTTPHPNSSGGVPPHPNSSGGVPPHPNSSGGVPPRQNSFGAVPPHNSFGSASMQNNFGNTASQMAGGFSMPGQYPSFQTKGFPDKPTAAPGQTPLYSSVLEPAASDSAKVVTDQCEMGAQPEVNKWLKKAGKFKEEEMGNNENTTQATVPAMELDAEGKKQHSLSIGAAHDQLRAVLYALAAVQGELQQMEEMQETADAATWDAAVVKMKKLQEAYLKVKQEVDLHQLRDVKRKLDLRRKKRERQRRRKQEAKEEEQQVLFERVQKHAAIDQWLERIQQEHINQQQVKRMKETADKTLSKVRREIREARKMLDTVTRLQKLRAIRNDTAEKRGQTFAPSVAEHFQDKTGDLTQLLTQQIESCEKEEAALKLILETEKEEAKEKEKEEKRQKEKELRQSEMKEEQCCLFGLQGQPYPGHPMEPFTRYYQQALYNLHSLQSIRQEWDMFLVPEETPMASRIPDGWVIPESPSSSAWASALQSQSS